MTRRLLSHGIVVAFVLTIAATARAGDGCEPEPITPNTPTGIAGCERWGPGIASHYGPGNGVAMNFCTWERRHSEGCGWVAIQSEQTGLTVVAEVVDFCDCYTGTSSERIVDLQYGIVAALGLQLADGLFPVRVHPVGSGEEGQPVPPVREGEAARVLAPPIVLPDTALPRYNGITEDESVDALESQSPGRRTHPTIGRGIALLEDESR